MSHGASHGESSQSELYCESRNELWCGSQWESRRELPGMSVGVIHRVIHGANHGVSRSVSHSVSWCRPWHDSQCELWV